jgi:hypothetical protein
MAMAETLSPDTRTTPTPPRPGAVAMATIGSAGWFAVAVILWAGKAVGSEWGPDKFMPILSPPTWSADKPAQQPFSAKPQIAQFTRQTADILDVIRIPSMQPSNKPGLGLS